MFKTEDKLKIVYEDYFDPNNLLVESESVDFIHVNDKLNYSATLNNTEWKIQYEDTSIFLPQNVHWELISKEKQDGLSDLVYLKF